MTKTVRQSKIRELIENKEVRNQEELRSLLIKNGIEATQATLSRDLREIGAVKSADGYSLSFNGNGHAHGPGDEFNRLIKLFLSQVQYAGNIALLKTAPGNAHALAVAIDRAKIEGVLGTLAGDDTIFAITRSPSDSKRFTRYLLSLVQGN